MIFDTLPLCNFLNSSCPTYFNINGTVYFDADTNCSYGFSDHGIPNVLVTLSQNTVPLQCIVTGLGGHYSFQVPSYGNYDICVDTFNSTLQLVCPSSSCLSANVNAGDTIISGVDFGWRCKSGFDLGVWGMDVWPVKPNTYVVAYITAGNPLNTPSAACSAGVSAQVSMKATGPVSFYGPAPDAIIPDTITSSEVVWNIPDISQVSSSSSFNMVVYIDSNAAIGQEISIDALNTTDCRRQ